MKKTTLLLICLSLTILTQAQVSRTLVSTAGGLSDSLSSAEKSTITNLTIKGNIDASDFTTMRDSMPLLAVINMDSATIDAYTGTLGTAGTTSISYAANTLPNHAFTDPISSAGKLSLKTIVMPFSITAIGYSAFSNCTGITSADIPASVQTISWWTFSNCTGLTTLNFPPTVNTIADFAFAFCTHLNTINIPASATAIGDDVFTASSGAITVDAANPNYSSSDGLLFNKSKTTLLHCPISNTGSFIIPSIVTNIAAEAFENCSALNSVTIPSTVTSIGANAFKNLSHLQTINSYNAVPIDLSTSATVFGNDTVTKIILYVPAGSLGAYQAANQWSAFTNIEEFALSVSLDELGIGNAANSKDSVDVTSNTSWTASSDQAWLVVSPTSDSANGKLVFTAAANPLIISRLATITVSALGTPSKTIGVIQDGANIVLSLSANTANIAKDADSKDSVNVTSNTNWTASSNQTWLVVSPLSDSANGKIIFTAQANTAINSRQATITVSATGVSSSTVTVTQYGSAAELSVDASAASVAKEAGSTAKVAVTSNTDWTASSDQIWLVVSPTSGSGNDTLLFTAAVNTTVATRQAIVTLSASGATSKTVTITQDAATAVLSVSATTATVAKEVNSQASVDVTSNTAWTASSNETWLVVSPTSGSDNGTLTFTAEANPASTTRDATITVSAAGVTPKTITVTQDAGDQVGISTETTENVSLYPNPAQNVVYVSTTESLRQIVICNISGSIVVSQNNLTSNRIDISSLEKGIYLFYITTDKGTSMKKIVKE